MRGFYDWLREGPIRLYELCSATVLLVAAVWVGSFVASVLLYSLAVLLFVSVLGSFLGQGRRRR